MDLVTRHPYQAAIKWKATASSLYSKEVVCGKQATVPPSTDNYKPIASIPPFFHPLNYCVPIFGFSPRKESNPAIVLNPMGVAWNFQPNTGFHYLPFVQEVSGDRPSRPEYHGWPVWSRFGGMILGRPKGRAECLPCCNDRKSDSGRVS